MEKTVIQEKATYFASLLQQQQRLSGASDKEKAVIRDQLAAIVEPFAESLEATKLFKLVVIKLVMGRLSVELTDMATRALTRDDGYLMNAMGDEIEAIELLLSQYPMRVKPVLYLA